MADGGYARLALFRAEFRGCSRSVTTEVTTPRWQELASRQFCKQYGIVGQTGIWVDIGQQWTAMDSVFPVAQIWFSSVANVALVRRIAVLGRPLTKCVKVGSREPRVVEMLLTAF